MTASPDREIMNVEEAAQLLGVSVKTFNKVLHSESLPGRKIGREWKFSRRALIDWVGSGRSDQFYREARRRAPGRAIRNGSSRSGDSRKAGRQRMTGGGAS